MTAPAVYSTATVGPDSLVGPPRPLPPFAVSGLAWFVAGATATGLAMCATRLRRSTKKANTRVLRAPKLLANRVESSPEPSPEPSPEVPLTVAPAADEVAIGDARQMASSIAEEIADLASAVEGAAFELVAAAPEPTRLPHAAQRFLGSVQRLRSLHGKLVAFGSDVIPTTGTADLGEVVASLTEELQRLRLGLELEAELTPGLPPTTAGPETVRNALLFACTAMFRAEPGAMHLSIAAERCLSKRQLRIELLLESVADPTSGSSPPMHDSNVTLAIEAATRLVKGHGGEVTMTRLPGRTVRTLILLPAADAAEVTVIPAPPERDPSTVGPHHFGGALVVEADPDVRDMLAKELRASGRSVFACADSTSARTFLEATPDRFELLIVDQQHRLADGDALGETIRRLTPDLKICVLSPIGDNPTDAHTEEQWPGLRRIEKPFGVHELRQALASVLGAR